MVNHAIKYEMVKMTCARVCGEKGKAREKRKMLEGTRSWLKRESWVESKKSMWIMSALHDVNRTVKSVVAAEKGS